MSDPAELARLRARYGGANEAVLHDPAAARVARAVFDPQGTRSSPYSGIPTLLDAPYRPLDPERPDFGDLQVALVGVPMDLGITNRPGARFGPRALRTIERIGPYEPVLECVPARDLRVADIGDLAFRSRYSLELCHQDIEAQVSRIAAAGVAPLAVGGDHSVSLPILKALGAAGPVGLIHLDAHCDTGGAFDLSRFHHGGPFRQAVLAGVLDPKRTVQIGIRGASGFLWEFSRDSGMTVISAEEVARLGIPAVIERARQVVDGGPVYLSFDIDVLDPAFAPGTGTPEVGGLSTREVIAFLRGLSGIDLIGGDVVEVAPQYDPGTVTALAAAQVLFQLLALMVFSPSIGARW